MSAGHVAVATDHNILNNNDDITLFSSSNYLVLSYAIGA